MMRISVVVAAYDEKDTIEELTRRLHRTLASLAEPWEMVFVVEGRDGTREILARLAAELGGDIRILYNEEPSGLGNAFRRGFAAVAPDAGLVVTLDADLNHQPEEIPRLIAALFETGSDIVVGSRFLAASRVEGTPRWKWFLSRTMNSLMRRLYDRQVLDKTSGFRVYRAAALARIEFTNPAFAFLPEMLIRAHQAGLRITEEPIRFIFRTAGTSKLKILPTTLSYLSLLRARFNRRHAAVLLLLLAGLAVRVAVAYPTHFYPADADCLLEGLCADKVLHGDTPVFFSGFRIGSLECHLTAVLFVLFGRSRDSLALGPVILGCALLIVAYRMARLLCGRRAAIVALLFLAVPPPAVLFWTYMPNGYPAILLLCAAILWLAARLARAGARRRDGAAFGLAAGLGLWQSLLTLACLLPALGWLAWRRPRLWRDPRLWLVGLGAFVVGAFPWLAFNGLYQMPSFSLSTASRPAAGPAAVLSNAAYFAGTNLPELLASLDPELGLDPPGAVQRTLLLPVLAIYGAAALWFLVVPAFARRRGRQGRGGASLSAWLLFTGVAVAVFALNALSTSGSVRGITVRYVLPLWLAAAPVLALFLTAVARRKRWGKATAVALAACVVWLDLAGYRWPGDARRHRLEEADRAQRQAVRALTGGQMQAVLGNYWAVYPITFLSNERILGIPCNPQMDLYHYALKLPAPTVRWGLLAGARASGELAAWAARARLPGETRILAPEYAVFEPPTGTPLGPELVDRLQAACGPLGPPTP